MCGAGGWGGGGDEGGDIHFDRKPRGLISGRSSAYLQRDSTAPPSSGSGMKLGRGEAERGWREGGGGGGLLPWQES